MGRELAVGAKAPAFTLKRDGGTSVALKDFKTRNLVLYFYPKADTPGCTKQACGFRDARLEYLGRGVQALGISLDSVAENNAFAKKFSIEYPLLCDVDHTVALAYKAIDSLEERYAKRFTYVIGADGKIEKAIDTKNPGAQAAELLGGI
jgi:peroxiredoxin Q/BCP